MESVSNICKKILLEQPFYGFFLCGLNKRFSDKIDTACVSIEGINTSLKINKEYWNKLDINGRKFVLLHELGHITLLHMAEIEQWNAFCPDHRLLNIGLDMAVNTQIDKSIWLDDSVGCQLLTKFPDLERGRGGKYYINFLRKIQNEDASHTGNQGMDQSMCDYFSMPQAEREKIKRMLDSAPEHNWEQFEKLTDSEKEMVKSQIDFQLKEAYKQAGTAPGCLTDYLNNLLTGKPPVYNWRQALRRCFDGALDMLRKPTRKRESKRFDEAMGTKHKRKHNILIGIDTSGSVSMEDFKDVFNEINHAYKAGANAHILECDTNITNEYDYKGKLPDKVAGRGGTDLQPIYDYYLNAKGKYTMLVVFTDGYCDLPTKPLFRTIWVISKNGRQQDYPGYTIYIKD